MEIKYKQAEEAVWATCGGCAAGQPRGQRSQDGGHALRGPLAGRPGHAGLQERGNARPHEAEGSDEAGRALPTPGQVYRRVKSGPKSRLQESHHYSVLCVE